MPKTKERRILTISGPKPPESSAESSKGTQPTVAGKENSASAPVPAHNPLLLLIEAAVNTAPVSTVVPKEDIATLIAENGIAPPLAPWYDSIYTSLPTAIQIVNPPNILLSVDATSEYYIKRTNVNVLMEDTKAYISCQYEWNQHGISFPNFTADFLYFSTFYKLWTDGKIDNNILRTELLKHHETGVLTSISLLKTMNTLFMPLIQSEIKKIKDQMEEMSRVALNLVGQVQSDRRDSRNEIDCQIFADLMKSDLISTIKLVQMATLIKKINSRGMLLKQFIEVMRTYCAQELYHGIGLPVPQMLQRQLHNALSFFEKGTDEYNNVAILQVFCTGLNAVKAHDYGVHFLQGKLAFEIDADLFYESVQTVILSWKHEEQRNAPLTAQSSAFQPT